MSPLGKLSRSDLFACALLALLSGALIWNRATFDIWIARHDNLTAYLPWWSYLGERLSAGQIPGWNPYQFSGIPFLADPQSGWMHAPTMLAFIAFDPITAMTVKAAIEILIAGFSAYALARVLGYRPIAAFAGASLYIFGPFSLFTTHCCTVRLHIATWVPLALLGPEIALRAQSRAGRLAGIAIGGFAYSQMLAGWLGQGTYSAALIIGAWTLYRSLTIAGSGQRIRSAMTGLAVGAAVGLFGMALNAAALFPRLATNGETWLGAGNYDRLALGYSYDPFGLKNLIATLLDDDFRHRGFTVPAAGLLLALLAVSIAPRRHPVPFFAGLTVVVYWLTLNWGPPYWLLSLLPRWRELHDHYPQQVASAVMIGPAMLAAAAVDTLPKLHRMTHRVPRIAIPLGAIAAAIAWIASIQGNNRPLLFPVIVLMVTSTLVALLATRRFRTLTRPVLLSLGLLIFIEPTGLELVDAYYNGRIIQGWYEFWDPSPDLEAAAGTAVATSDPTGAGQFLQERLDAIGPFRYAGYGGSGYPGNPPGTGTYMERRAEAQIEAILVNGRSLFLDLYDMQGYNPTQLSRYVEYVTAMNGRVSDYHLAELRIGGIGSPLLDMLNVRYVLVDARLPDGRDDVEALTQGREPVFQNQYVRVYENTGAFPHAWLVHDIRHVNRLQSIALLQERAVDFRQVALVEDGAPNVTRPPSGAAESAEVSRYEPERVTIAVNAATDGLLIISDPVARGWRATVDGEPAPIYPANVLFRAVPVPAGAHTVVLTYEPPWLRIGLLISALAHAVLLAAVAWWAVASRNSPR